MSEAEIKRLIADRQENADMRQALQGSATGVAGIVAFAKERGYDIEVADVRSHIEEVAGRALSESELDQVAGGTGVLTIVTSNSPAQVTHVIEASATVATTVS